MRIRRSWWKAVIEPLLIVIMIRSWCWLMVIVVIEITDRFFRRALISGLFVRMKKFFGKCCRRRLQDRRVSSLSVDILLFPEPVLQEVTQRIQLIWDSKTAIFRWWRCKQQNKMQNWTERIKSKTRTKIADRYSRHQQEDRISSPVSNQCVDAENPSQEDSPIDSKEELFRFGWDTCRRERSEGVRTYATKLKTPGMDHRDVSLDRAVRAESCEGWWASWMDWIDPPEIDRRFVLVRFSWWECFLLFEIHRCVARRIDRADRDLRSQSYAEHATETDAVAK